MASTFTTAKLLEKQGTGDNSGTWGVVLNAALDDVDQALAGMLSKSVAGSSNVTLTDDEATNAILKLTGLLTGNIEVRVPARTSSYRVWNATTGAFTLTFKTVAGTGIVVDQGTVRDVFCDGTNVAGVIPETGLPTADGGTGSTTPAGARAGLGVHLELISVQDGSGTDHVDFAGISATYDEYEIHFYDIRMTNDGGVVCFRVSIAGSVKSDANYLYNNDSFRNGFVTNSPASSQTEIFLTGTVDNGVTGYAVTGVVKIRNPLGTTYYKNITSQTEFRANSDNAFGTIITDGLYVSTSAVDSLRIFSGNSGGNFLTGKFKFYGKRATA